MSTLLTLLLTAAIIAVALIAADVQMIGAGHVNVPVVLDDKQLHAKLVREKARATARYASHIERRRIRTDCAGTPAEHSAPTNDLIHAIDEDHPCR